MLFKYWIKHVMSIDRCLMSITDFCELILSQWYEFDYIVIF